MPWAARTSRPRRRCPTACWTGRGCCGGGLRGGVVAAAAALLRLRLHVGRGPQVVQRHGCCVVVKHLLLGALAAGGGGREHACVGAGAGKRRCVELQRRTAARGWPRGTQRRPKPCARSRQPARHPPPCLCLPSSPGLALMHMLDASCCVAGVRRSPALLDDFV
jgi:hypothetical protein